LSQPKSTQRLDSWKEIAAFFGRDERTVRRWEIDRAMPVHRLPGEGRGVVYALTNELEEWLHRREIVQEKTDEQKPDQTRTETTGSNQTTPPTVVAPEVQGNKPSQSRAFGYLRRGIRFLPWVAAAALAIAVFAGVYVYRRTALFQTQAAVERTNAPARSLDRDSIAVLPLANVRADANSDYLIDGITESLIGNLAHVPQLKVRSRDSAFRYKGKDVEARRAGNELGVSAVVSGRVTLQGDNIEISTELTDVPHDTEIWGQHYRGKVTDLIRLQQQIAGDIAGRLRSKLSTSERQQVTRQGTENPEAYEPYLKGRYEWNKRTLRDLESAISYFNQAIAKDPAYALAYSGLADAYGILPDYGGTPAEDFPKSNIAARRALELDPTLARPHAVLGVNEMQFENDFAGGQAEFKKAFELDPNDATAHQWYSEQLAKIGGFEAQALTEANRARQLDPTSPIINREVAYAYLLARRYDDAIAICKKLAADEPTFAAAHSCLFYAYWGKRMYPAVIEEQKVYGQLCGNPNEAEFASALERGFQEAGWKRALKKGIEVRLEQRKSGYYSAFLLADLYADLGDKDAAFRWLGTAYQERESGMKMLKTDYLLDPLRSDPRFPELLRKVGLPQ
jgi:TolB-like protein